MKKVNCIRFFFIFTVLFTIVCYQSAIQTQKSKPPTQEKVIPETESMLLPVGNITTDYKYVIVEEGDYLTVYFSDQKRVYDYTDIRYSDLEDTLRHKIRKGYRLKDDKALFDFLENYSS